MVQKVRDDPKRLGCKSLFLSLPLPLHLLSFFARFTSHVLTIPFCIFISAVNCFQVDCLRRKYEAKTPAQGGPGGSPTSPTSPSFLASPVVSEADTLPSQPSNSSSALTAVAPDLISQFEINFWYHGISGSPPKLLWRSDFETNPFRMPQVGERFFKLHPKTAYGVFGTRLNEVWDTTVAPQILKSLKAHRLKYSALKTARFLTVDEEKGEETLGPIVVWIAVPPNTTSAAAVRDATPDILHILNDAQVTGVVVEWYEGTAEKLAGPPLMSVADETSPIFGLSHPFNAGLGIPIARASDDVQGTVALLFREVKTSDGNPSNTILALTNKHVATLDTTTHYDLDAANPRSILVCGERRFDRAFSEVEDALNTGLRDAARLAGELKELEAKAGGQTTTRAMQRKQAALNEKNEDNETLQELFDQVDETWRDVNNRKFAQVHWAPEISVRVGDRPYTRDIATLAVDEEKLENFTANIVDLGTFRFHFLLNPLFLSLSSFQSRLLTKHFIIKKLFR